MSCDLKGRPVQRTEARAFVVRPAEACHIREVARLHARCIEGGFLSSLGEEFLARLYEAMRQHPGTDVLVCLSGGEVVGFVTGSEDVGRLYRWVLWHRPLGLGLPLVRRLFSLSRLKRVLETLLYPTATALRGLPRAEALSLAVRREFRGLGLGRKLMEAVLRRLRDRGVTEVRGACTEGLLSNALLRRLGFDLAVVKDHHGAALNVYTYAFCPARAAQTLGDVSPAFPSAVAVAQ